MESLNALQQVDQALDTNAKSLLARYGACVNAGGAGTCDAAFNSGLNNLDSSSRARATDVKNAMSSASACVKSGNDPSSCFRQMATALSRKYMTPANNPNGGSANSRILGLDSNAPQPKFPMTGRELAGSMGIESSHNVDIDEQLAAAKAQIESTTGGFDPSQIYSSVPSVNPLAHFPNEDLIGRTKKDTAVDPFHRDIRPPVFSDYKPWNMLMNTRRISELESQRKRQDQLRNGMGYSAANYCQN